MNQLFVNGPIQNGNFSFAEMPGRAVSLRVCEAFNDLASGCQAPDLWNTVTLKSDVQYADTGNGEDRGDYERRRIKEKYAGTDMAGRPTMTDADPEVTQLGLTLVERGLSEGTLQLSDEIVNVCRSCAHMVGGAAACKACGSDDIQSSLQKHLVYDRDTSEPVLTPDNIYSHGNARDLATIAGHVPERLIMSRTRAYGIDLGAIGLQGLVLDPRAGLHVTCLAAGERLGAQTTSMVVSQKAAGGLLAYGLPFRRTDSQALTYALHGYVPSDAIQAIEARMPADQAEQHRLFANWFMSVNAMASRNDIPSEQVPALYKFFGKVFRAQQDTEQRAQLREQVRDQINLGKLRWITDKVLLSAAMPRET
jgi:hypothetical protein